MKINKILGMCLISTFILACGRQESSETSENNDESTIATTESQDDPKGKVLISQSDCLSCHNEKNKIVGPSYKEVAAKYENTPENITMLAGKIIKGGQGNWGEVPMTAHPQLSQEDAEEMARYILTVK